MTDNIRRQGGRQDKVLPLVCCVRSRTNWLDDHWPLAVQMPWLEVWRGIEDVYTIHNILPLDTSPTDISSSRNILPTVFFYLFLGIAKRLITNLIERKV